MSRDQPSPALCSGALWSGPPRLQLGSIVVVAALIVAACTAGGADDDGQSIDITTVVSTTPPTTSEPTAPDTEGSSGRTLDDQIDWVLNLLNGGSTTETEVTERFAAEFLAQSSPAAIVASIGQLQALAASWTVADREGDGIFAEVRLTTESDPWILLIAVIDGSIESISLEPDTLGDVDQPTTFDELVDVLGEVGDVALLAADVSGGTCEPIHAVEASSPRPIGSDFKLYVLGALLEAIAVGDVGWDDTLTIRAELKSLPSGTFQDLADGTERTVRDFAEAMIAISDNTATDHLIDLLGRDRVEAAQATYGHTAPELNIPFLTTRELFVLKLALSENDRDAYIAAEADERRVILENDVATREVSLEDAERWITPRAIGEIEWFASPIDLCRAMIALHADSTDPTRASVRAILGANPGIAEHTPLWSYVGFKGGGEPGVLSLAWYLEGDRGTYVYVVNVTNTDTTLPELQLVELTRTGFDLLAGT